MIARKRASYAGIKSVLLQEATKGTEQFPGDLETVDLIAFPLRSLRAPVKICLALFDFIRVIRVIRGKKDRDWGQQPRQPEFNRRLHACLRPPA